MLDRIAVLDSNPAPLVARLVAHQYAVLVARDGDQLETLALRRRPDLVIGDLGADGCCPAELCRQLKHNVLLRHIPVIVVTDHAELQSRVDAVNGGADDYLVEPYDEAELLARIRRAIARAHDDLDANPLTRLPGNASIKAELDERIASGAPFAALFVDLDGFKAFNDRYGFERGDDALRVLGDTLLEAVGCPGNGVARDFVGNIGGDDFVVITTMDRAEPIAARICELVDRRMPRLYDEPDRALGYITAADRQGMARQFPLLTVSVAIVTSDDRRFRHHSEISEIGSELKAYLKQHAGSRYLTNRRRAPSLPASVLAAGPAAGGLDIPLMAM